MNRLKKTYYRLFNFASDFISGSKRTLFSFLIVNYSPGNEGCKEVLHYNMLKMKKKHKKPKENN